MKNTLLTISAIFGGILSTVSPASKLKAETHKLEIALQKCYYTKKFAKTVMEKRKDSRPFSYYQKIDFESPVAMEIVLQAYNTDRTVSEFSNYWFEKCQEIDCNEFWADLEVATKLVSE